MFVLLLCTWHVSLTKFGLKLVKEPEQYFFCGQF